VGLIASVSFAIQPLSESDGPSSIVPVLNGVYLTQLIEDFERAHGFEPAGGYAGLVPTFFNYGPLDLYFMGEADREYLDKAGYYLLGCSCGEVGCWPLTAKISQAQRKIVWDSFRQPHRPDRDYSPFGPFEFDLDQYRREVVALVSKFPAN
jgi:hypothetical protein